MSILSIIVPVYNVSPYLREGLDSILNQEVQDIKNDPFTINRCFCFSDSPKNGLEYNVSNTNIIKKEMLMVL